MPARPSARWGRIPTLVLVVALVAAACTDDGTGAANATSTTIPRPNTVMRIGVEEWPSCVNPLTCNDGVLHDLVLQHVLPVAFEFDADDDYRPSSLLARAPAISEVDGGAAIRYEIAPAARWADGRPITSSDFVGTWQAIMSTPGADRSRYERITAIDDTDPAVAVVQLDSLLVDWQELFGGSSGYLLQADAFGPSTDLTGQFADALPFAAGPYLLSSWSDSGAVLSAIEPWDGADAPGIDQVRLDRVEIASLDDPMTFDMLIPSPGSAEAAPEGFDVRSTDSTTVLGLWFDQREPALQPVEHRRAFAALLDRSTLANAAGLGDVVPCAGWVPDVGPWCEAATVEPADASPAAASSQLDALGWVSGGFGRVRDSERLVLPVTTDPAVMGSAAVAASVSASLRGIGVDAPVLDKTTLDWLDDQRPLSASTGLGVFAIDLGMSPLVDDLYGCPSGLESSLVASCPAEITGPARALATQSADQALATVEFLGVAADFIVLWRPLAVVPDHSFIRRGRVVVAEASNAAGGPTAGLERFEADT